MGEIESGQCRQLEPSILTGSGGEGAESGAGCRKTITFMEEQKPLGRQGLKVQEREQWEATKTSESQDPFQAGACGGAGVETIASLWAASRP